MVIVADGTAEADEKLERVLTCDPGIGVVRHADAGYPEALATAKSHGIRLPMRDPSTGRGRQVQGRGESRGSRTGLNGQASAG